MSLHLSLPLLSLLLLSTLRIRPIAYGLCANDNQSVFFNPKRPITLYAL